ncbi:acyl-CoA acyltransferase [Deinococcus sp. SDU3-2]|uniref:Acyl-CoA acyltransferase n=1 Tax=Deinococcus terrestris TaxID=2651870 RepID=A0A7X1NY24_9DEIO|nr:acyl-CoA acyltransferase [Deinococcus terrestris]MPY67882.1 acyl-CoA acyltransferase [Deinococcus terrestris]
MRGRAFVVRDVTDPWAMRRLEDVQVGAWGYADREVLPATMFRIGAHTGAVVLGAYPEDDPETPFGLAYGFPALGGGEVWHHSHLLAVRPDWRGSGAAVALKHAQRERVLAQGLTRMTWTFDPLVARNARLNLGKLGARAVSYHPDWYALGEARETAFPADRLMVEWDLTQPQVERPAPGPEGEVVLEGKGDVPASPRLDATSPRLLAEVPLHAEPLPDDVRLAWRLALRAVLGTYLECGYAVTDLAREGERAFYVLTK